MDDFDRDLIAAQALPEERADAIYAFLSNLRYWESRFDFPTERRLLAFITAQIESAIRQQRFVDEEDIVYMKGPSPYEVVLEGEGYRLGEKEASP